MTGKSQIWLDEIMHLSPEDKKHEIDMMKMEIHNLELKMFVYDLTSLISNYQEGMTKILLENIQLHREKEIG